MPQTPYPHLFSPLTIRGKTFKNRILLAPMGVEDNYRPGILGPGAIDFYTSVAEGGVARVIGPENDVEFGSSVFGHYWYFVDEPPTELLENTKRYVENCHKNGALAFMHFGYMGAYGRSAPADESPQEGMLEARPGTGPDFLREMLAKMTPKHSDGTPYQMHEVGGPSTMVISEPWDGVTSQSLNMDGSDGKHVMALTVERMNEIADAFAHCAQVVKSCGMDGMSIHSGHGFIFSQWISRRFNHRTDEYGGESMENRARFPIMCLQRIRDAVGDDFLIEMRFSAEEAIQPITDKEYIPDVVTLQESVAFFKEIDKHPGLLDIAHITGGLHTVPIYNVRTTANAMFPNGLNVEAAAAIKAAVKNIKVGVVGSMSDPALCEEVIASGKADLVILCRQLLFADKDFPKKAAGGEDYMIDNCLRCVVCRQTGVCAVNPFDPVEDPEHAEIRPSAHPGKIVVVGGGIGGMKAAEYARKAGHQVVLLEQKDRLGGILCYTDHDKFKKDLFRFYRNMAIRMEKIGVEVRLSTKATPELVAAEQPLAVIVATGGKPSVLPVPVAPEAHLIDALDVYLKPETVRGTVAIIGAGLTGCEAAIHLGDQGVRVNLVSRSEKLMRKVQPRRPADGSVDTHLIWLDKLSDIVTPYKGYACKAITAEGVVAVCTATGEEVLIPADTVVNATGMQPDPDQAAAFRGCAQTVIPIGDSVNAALVGDAVLAARNAVQAIG